MQIYKWTKIIHGNWRLAPKLSGIDLVCFRHICRRTKIPTSQIEVYKLVNRETAIKTYLPYTLSTKMLMRLQELPIHET